MESVLDYADRCKQAGMWNIWMKPTPHNNSYIVNKFNAILYMLGFIVINHFYKHFIVFPSQTTQKLINLSIIINNCIVYYINLWTIIKQCRQIKKKESYKRCIHFFLDTIVGLTFWMVDGGLVVVLFFSGRILGFSSFKGFCLFDDIDLDEFYYLILGVGVLYFNSFPLYLVFNSAIPFTINSYIVLFFFSFNLILFIFSNSSLILIDNLIELRQDLNKASAYLTVSRSGGCIIHAVANESHMKSWGYSMLILNRT